MCQTIKKQPFYVRFVIYIQFSTIHHYKPWTYKNISRILCLHLHTMASYVYDIVCGYAIIRSFFSGFSIRFLQKLFTDYLCLSHTHLHNVCIIIYIRRRYAYIFGCNHYIYFKFCTHMYRLRKSMHYGKFTLMCGREKLFVRLKCLK